MSDELSLQVRLRNCLQTILELREDLDSVSFGLAFVDELGMIRNFMKKIDSVKLCEDDVLRIEQATTVFLRELACLFEQERPSGDINGSLRLQ